MRTYPRDADAGSLAAVGSAALMVSLFLTWSHQMSAAARSTFRPLGALAGVPVNASAWQVYTTADVLLALLAVALVAVTVWGSFGWRLVTALAALGALAFTIHALVVPPTDGLLLVKPTATAGAAAVYEATGARAGLGEAVAVGGLVVALGGLLLSMARDRRRRAGDRADRWM